MCMAGAKDARTRRPTRQVMTRKQGIHALENSKDTDNQSEFYFDQLEINTLGTAGNIEGTQALVQLKFPSPQCTNQLICKLDTVAEGNVIPLTTYKTMSPHCNVTHDGIPTNLHPSNMRITAYGGHTVTQYGTCKLQVTHRNESVMSTFHAVNSNGPTIIGLPTCRALTTYKTMYPHGNVTLDGIPTNLHPSNMQITAYGGHTGTHYGTCKRQVTHINESVMGTFHVVNSN